MPTAHMDCSCGAVGATITVAAARAVRVLCYCDDCQAYAHHLGRSDLLDAHGGTDIIQIAPSALVFTRGQERIAGVRLAPQGVYRWYARCCNTPVGNSVGPRLASLGIIAQTCERPDQRAEAVFGPVLGGIFGRYAVGDVPKHWHGLPARILVPAVARVALWKLRGKTWPHPFFARDTGAALYPVTVLSPSERAGLRELCGPRAA